MKNTTYDNLKIIALIVAPIMTFVATILKIWNVPYSTQILSTLSALDVLVGSIVAISNEIYKKNKNKNKGKKK